MNTSEMKETIKKESVRKKKMKEGKKTTDGAAIAYETLLRCRELELNHFVSRSNICVLVQGALLAFATRSVFSEVPQTGQYLAQTIVVALAGIVLSIISLRVVKGSYFWVSYWEYRLSEIEKELIPEMKIFGDHPSFNNKAAIQKLRQLDRPLIYVSSRKAIVAIFYLFLIV